MELDVLGDEVLLRQVKIAKVHAMRVWWPGGAVCVCVCGGRGGGGRFLRHTSIPTPHPGRHGNEIHAGDWARTITGGIV